LQRRTFIKTSAATALIVPAWRAFARGQSNGQPADGCATAFVWQPMVPSPADVPALNGHTDTIPDIVGRLGSRIDLAIFTEGNHFPALLGGASSMHSDPGQRVTRTMRLCLSTTSWSSLCRSP